MSTTDTTTGAPDHDGVAGRDHVDPIAAASTAGSPTAPGAGTGSAGPGAVTRRGRIGKWDRPPPPHDWRWFVGGLGKILIALGLLMFGFVGYQLYGTGIQTAAAQNQLENQFEELLAATTPAAEPEPDLPAADETPDTVAAPEPVEPAEPAVVAVPVDQQNLNAVENGDALARIEIPSIGVDDIVVAGVDKGDLQKGPGHFPETPMPGQLGNSAIAGHRTTYGQPFRNVDDLVPGDEIRMTTLNGRFVYRVTGQQIVSPSDYQVVATTDPTTANLTLTSCHPAFTARERIVIFSELDTAESTPVGEAVLNYGRDAEPELTEAADPVDDPTLDRAEAVETPDEVVTDDVDTAAGAEVSSGPADESPDVERASESPADEAAEQVAVNAGIADAFSESWFSDPGANAQVGLWGAALTAIALAAYAISRRLRRDWAGLLLGILPFTVALYFFFQNVNRLLPPNL